MADSIEHELGSLNDTIKSLNSSLKSFGATAKVADTGLKDSAKAANQFSTGTKAFVAGFAGALGYNALKSVAGSSGGMDSVDKTFNLLAGTVGNLLMPGFVALGAAALAASDYLQGVIDENLDSVVNTWTDAIEECTTAVDAFNDALEGKRNPNQGIVGQNLSNTVMTFTNPGKAFDNFFTDLLGTAGVNANVLPKERERLGSGGSSVGGDFGKESMTSLLAKNMKVIAQDMRANGPGNAGISDPAGKWRELALGMARSQLDQKQEQQRQKMISLVEQIANNLANRADANNVATAGAGRRRP